MTAEEIAEVLNITPGYYYKLERGEKRLNQDHLNKLAKLLNVSLDYLLNLNDREEIFPDYVAHIEESNIAMLPIIGDIAAGIPITAVPENDEYMPFDTSLCRINGNELNVYFYFRIKGSQWNQPFTDRDIVLVHKQPIVENGQVA
jgi:repressor LexA